MSEKNFKNFWCDVDVGDDKSCWPWRRYVGKFGYGETRFGGRVMKAHRIAFLFANGFLPEAVCHSCDNPPCCNPSHLFAGTKSMNNADRHAKGRSAGPKGEAHAAHKITVTDVVEIRKMLMRGMTNMEIAAQFNIHNSTVSDIKRRKSWRHVA